MAYICEFDCCGISRKDNELFVEWVEADGKTAAEIKYVREKTCTNKRSDINQSKEHDAPNNWYAFLCSECGMGQRLQYQNDYCPNCGAKVVE